MVAAAKNLSNRGQLFSLLFYVGHKLAFEVGVFVFGFQIRFWLLFFRATLLAQTAKNCLFTLQKVK